MKWFSIILATGVLLLAGTPFWVLLLKTDDTAASGTVITRNAEGEEIVSLDPAVYGKAASERPIVICYTTYSSKIKSLDPATCGDNVSGGIQGNIYESLMTYDFLARPMKLTCQLAEDFPTISEDKLTYTFKIKKGVKYHRNACFGMNPGGQPKTRTVTAEDFILGFKRIADAHINTDLAFAFIEDNIVGVPEYREKTKAFPKGDFSRYDKLDIKGLRAIDEHTLEIKLTKPWPQLPYAMAINSYAPIPREAIDYWLTSHKDGDKRVVTPMSKRTPEITAAEINAAVGTGAFYLTKFVDGGDIFFQRNPDFREMYYPHPPQNPNAHYKKLIAEGYYKDAGKRLPLIDRIESQFVADVTPMWMIFLSKRSDAAGIPKEVFSAVINPDKDLTDSWKKKGIFLKKYTTPTIYWFVFNMDDPILSASKSLRQAMQLGYDVEMEIKILQNDRGMRARAYVPRDFVGYAEAPSPYAKLDLALAKKKLAEAKKELAAKGLLKNGEIPPLTLDFGGKTANVRKRAEYARDQFKKIGLTVNVETNDWPTLQKKVHSKQCQMYSMGWGADYPDPENFLQLYYTPNIKRGTNNSNFSNPEFDKLYEKIAVMPSGPERKALVVKMLNILNEACPVMLQMEPAYFTLYHPWLRNVYPHPIGYGYNKYRGLDVEMRKKLGGGR